MTRYGWVTARKAEGFPITMAAKTAGVSRQAFSDWRRGDAATRRDQPRRRPRKLTWSG